MLQCFLMLILQWPLPHLCSVEPDLIVMTPKIATKNDGYRGIINKNYAHYTLYRSCLPIYEIAIVRSLSFLFVDFEERAKISVAIKSGSTVPPSARLAVTLLGNIF